MFMIVDSYSLFWHFENWMRIQRTLYGKAFTIKISKQQSYKIL